MQHYSSLLNSSYLYYRGWANWALKASLTEADPPLPEGCVHSLLDQNESALFTVPALSAQCKAGMEKEVIIFGFYFCNFSGPEGDIWFVFLFSYGGCFYLNLCLGLLYLNESQVSRSFGAKHPCQGPKTWAWTGLITFTKAGPIT